MITLSIRQPWAWLIVNGHKDIENREWPTRFRGRVLIHAGKTMARRYYEEVVDSLAMAIPEPVYRLIPPYEALERGGVVGVSTIVDCVTASESPWFQGEYGFVMRDSRPLPFFPVNGQLGFFDVRGVPHG
jgi:ASCH domain-containing protein